MAMDLNLRHTRDINYLVVMIPKYIGGRLGTVFYCARQVDGGTWCKQTRKAFSSVTRRQTATTNLYRNANRARPECSLLELKIRELRNPSVLGDRLPLTHNVEAHEIAADGLRGDLALVHWNHTKLASGAGFNSKLIHLRRPSSGPTWSAASTRRSPCGAWPGSAGRSCTCSCRPSGCGCPGAGSTRPSCCRGSARGSSDRPTCLRTRKNFRSNWAREAQTTMIERRKLENYRDHRRLLSPASLTYESRHVSRRLGIEIWFTDYCSLRQPRAARGIAQDLIICRRLWRDYSRYWNHRCKIASDKAFVPRALTSSIRYICSGGNFG